MQLSFTIPFRTPKKTICSKSKSHRSLQLSALLAHERHVGHVHELALRELVSVRALDLEQHLRLTDGAHGHDEPTTTRKLAIKSLDVHSHINEPRSNPSKYYFSTWSMSDCGGSTAAAPTWIKSNGASFGRPAHPSASNQTRLVQRLTQGSNEATIVQRTLHRDDAARQQVAVGCLDVLARKLHELGDALNAKDAAAEPLHHAPQTRREVPGARANVQHARLGAGVAQRNVREFQRTRVLPTTTQVGNRVGRFRRV
jgi:hypothetical protein